MSHTEAGTKKLSLAIHSSIAKAVEETAKDENLSFSAQLRSLINKGLESYDIKVRDNRVIEADSHY